MFKDAAGCRGTGRTKRDASSGYQTAWQRSTTSELFSRGCSADMYSCSACLAGS
jgi:hypothetical protein